MLIRSVLKTWVLVIPREHNNPLVHVIFSGQQIFEFEFEFQEREKERKKKRKKEGEKIPLFSIALSGLFFFFCFALYQSKITQNVNKLEIEERKKESNKDRNKERNKERNKQTNNQRNKQTNNRKQR